jgi:hypothetical protein
VRKIACPCWQTQNAWHQPHPQPHGHTRNTCSHYKRNQWLRCSEGAGRLPQRARRAVVRTLGIESVLVHAPERALSRERPRGVRTVTLLPNDVIEAHRAAWREGAGASSDDARVLEEELGAAGSSPRGRLRLAHGDSLSCELSSLTSLELAGAHCQGGGGGGPAGEVVGAPRQGPVARVRRQRRRNGDPRCQHGTSIGDELLEIDELGGVRRGSERQGACVGVGARPKENANQQLQRHPGAWHTNRPMNSQQDPTHELFRALRADRTSSVMSSGGESAAHHQRQHSRAGQRPRPHSPSRASDVHTS